MDIKPEDARTLRNNEDTHKRFLQGSFLARILSAQQNGTLPQLAEELAEERLLLEHQRSHDPLTQAYTRQMFIDILQKEVKWYAIRGINFGLIEVDVDHFKQINDTYGHKAGDNVLKELVKIMVEEVKGRGEVGRWGGEEFMLSISGINEMQEVVDIAETIRQRVQTELGTAAGIDQEVTMSLGVGMFGVEDDFEQKYKEVDANLYAAKNGGRNRVVATMVQV